MTLEIKIMGAQLSDVLPVFIELRRLGMPRELAERLLWRALIETGAVRAFNKELLTLQSLHEDLKSNNREIAKPTNSFSMRLEAYKNLLLYPLDSTFSLHQQSWLEHVLAVMLGVRNSKVLMFLALEQELTSEDQHPYFELMSVLFGPKGNNAYPSPYQLQDVEQYFVQIELKNLTAPKDFYSFALEFWEFYQWQNNLQLGWPDKLIPVLEQAINGLPDNYQRLVRPRFGLKTQIKTIAQIATSEDISRPAAGVRLSVAYQKLKTPEVASLLPRVTTFKSSLT